MGERAIPTSLAPEVIVTQISGDLYIKGWEKPEITVNARLEDLTLEEGNDQVQLSCQGNCDLRLPHGASLQVHSVQGSARLKLIDEPLTIAEVQGSLTIRDIVAAKVDVVNGNLSVRGVSGGFSSGQVKGNAEVRKVQGNCCLEDVQGNLDGWDIEGEIKSHVQGNVYLCLSEMRGAVYQIHADGNASCYIPIDASLRLVLSSRKELIKVHLGSESSTIRQPHYELTTNGGEITMEISAGGSLRISTRETQWGETPEETAFEAGSDGKSEEFSRQIARQVEAQLQVQMDRTTRQLNEEISHITERIGESGLSPEETERIIERLRRTSEREAARSQEKIRRAQEKLERKLESAQRRHEHRAEEFDRRTRHGKQSWSFQWPTSSPQSVSAERDAVTEEERLMVLHMLEQKKITTEEADRLLAALEGKLEEDEKRESGSLSAEGE